MESRRGFQHRSHGATGDGCDAGIDRDETEGKKDRTSHLPQAGQFRHLLATDGGGKPPGARLYRPEFWICNQPDARLKSCPPTFPPK